MGKLRAVTSVALAAALFALTGCSGGGGSAPLRAGEPQQAAPAVTVDLQQALRQLDALPTPDGVDAAAFASLKAALRELLMQRGTGKFTSVAPASVRSKVTDLTATADGSGASFHWSYRNEGDFNQDSIVSVADLTPLGIHFGKDSTAPDWATARAADGNENGQVDLPDLVSIGANFQSRVTGYYLQRSDTPDPGGIWTQVADVPFTSSIVPAGQLRQFDFLLDSALNAYYRVVPHDSMSAGIPCYPVHFPMLVGPGDWWMFGHDPQHTRRSPFTGPATNALKWAYTTGAPVASSPAIGVDGTVYVGSADDKLCAINPDGSLKWACTTGYPVSSSPAIGANGTVYVGSAWWDIEEDLYYGELYAMNPDGSLKWAYNTGATESSPAIGADGTVYVGSEDDNLYAINPDGSLKWTYTTGDWVDSSPAIGADGTVYVGSWDNDLYAINPDGSLKWSYATGSEVDSSPAIGADGTVYVGSDKLYAINPDGSLKWAYTTGDWVDSSPAIGADGTVYVGSYDHKFYAINPDGSLKWVYTTETWVHSSPAIGADGTVYVGSNDHKFYAINPDGSLKWAYATGGVVGSSPAIGADGTVYVGSLDDKLYAIGPGGS
jgi:outer membrane protein assembly factor BamB